MVILITLFSMSAPTRAQDGAVSKVPKSVKQHQIQLMWEAPPAERVKRLGKLVGHRMCSPKQALSMAKKVAEQDDVVADKPTHIEAKLTLGVLYHGQGSPEMAQSLAEQAYSMADELDAPKLMYRAAALDALVDRDVSGLSTALQRLIELCARLQDVGDIPTAALCASLMGKLAKDGSSWTEAAEFFELARKLATECGDSDTEAKALRQFGEMLTRLARWDQGLETLQDALEVSKKNELLSFPIRVSIAENSLERGEHETALLEIKSLLDDFAKKRVDKGATALAYEVMARAYLGLGKTQDAEVAVDKALEMLAERQYGYYLAQTTKAKVVSVHGEHETAITELDAVLEQTKNRFPGLYLHTIRIRATVLSASGRMSEAFAALQDAHKFEQELHRKESMSQIEVALQNMNQDSVDHELAKLKKEQALAEETASRMEAELFAAQTKERAQKAKTYASIVLSILGVLIAMLVAKLHTSRLLARREQETAEALAEKTQDLNLQLEAELGEKTVELRAELENRAELERALHQTRQIEAVGTLTSGVAHDFNNLMTVVLSSNETLKLTAAERLTPRELMALEESTQAANSGAIITRQLLEMARSQSNEPTRIHVQTFVNKIRGLLGRSLGDLIEMKIEYHDPEATVFVDATRLTTALMNLCCNAKYALDGRGMVRLQVSTIVAGDHDYLMEVESMHPRAEFVSIEVADEGCGMSPEELAKAKEPLFTTKPESEGTGLGLSVVQGFASEAGGLLHLESDLDVGTRASIVLPACGLDTSVPAIEGDGDQFEDIAGLSVVVVDDKETVLSSVARSLVIQGCSVDRYTDAEQVQEHFELGQRPDVVLADVRMPGRLDGLDLARWIQQHHPDTGIVLMTGFSKNLDFEFTALAKPFTIPQLAAAIKSEAPMTVTSGSAAMLAGSDTPATS